MVAESALAEPVAAGYLQCLDILDKIDGYHRLLVLRRRLTSRR
jgi:hypothetical protein